MRLVALPVHHKNDTKAKIMKSLKAAVCSANRVRFRVELLLVAAVCFACFLPSAHAGLVQWGTTLDAGLIPQNGSVTYQNVNGQGFDIKVTTSSLTASLAGNFHGQIPGAHSWDIQGAAPSTSSSTLSTPSTITFQFFQTGTLAPDTVPIGITGLNFRFEDADMGERFANFAYYDPLGVLQPILPNTSTVFTGVGTTTPNGLNTSIASSGRFPFASAINILENDAIYEPTYQPGKALQVNLASTPLSGFTFKIYRTDSGKGSVSMGGLGDLQLLQSPIPEPGTALFGLALLGVLASARRSVSARSR